MKNHPGNQARKRIWIGGRSTRKRKGPGGSHSLRFHDGRANCRDAGEFNLRLWPGDGSHRREGRALHKDRAPGFRVVTIKVGINGVLDVGVSFQVWVFHVGQRWEEPSLFGAVAELASGITLGAGWRRWCVGVGEVLVGPGTMRGEGADTNEAARPRSGAPLLGKTRREKRYRRRVSLSGHIKINRG